MATKISIIPLHQPQPSKALTGAERTRACRERKRAGQLAPAPGPKAARVTPAAPVTLHAVTPPRYRPIAPLTLTVAALSLAAVGVTMNGYFARSLGSTDLAGYLFLTLGVAADLAVLAIPTCAAQLWRTRQRGAAAAGWAVWLMTFVFAVTAGIGFASLNISDVTQTRASRATPAVTMAQISLTDAMAARDRECGHGVGKFCRERETTVTERRQAVDTAMRDVARTADPQTEAAVKAVAWLTMGALKPASDDFAMLRLILLALLPQVGGVLLMVGRAKKFP
jgi:hypothetical protein